LTVALFNNKGELQDVVPDNIAHDSTIPHPYPVTLEAGSSCFRCHLPHDGFIPANNDVLDMYTFLHNKGYLADIIDPDQDGGKDNLLKDLETAKAMYSGNLEVPFRIARDQHAVNTFKITRG